MSKKEILEEFEEKENEKKFLPDEVKRKINKRIFENMLIAVSILFFNILLIFGTFNIEKAVYLTDLKVFSIAFCVLAIFIWEISYKKDSGKICLWGIEIALYAVSIMFAIYVLILKEDKYIYYIALDSYFFSIYYTFKNIKIHKRFKNEYIKSLSDIDEIIKKPEPEKKEETTRKRR